jgi:hypothetical protein
VVYPSVACVAALVPLLAARWYFVPLDRKRTEWVLVVTALAVPLCAAAEAIANALSRIRPLKYDLFIYRIDALFGQPSFVVGRAVAQHLPLRILVSVSYGALPIAMVGVFAVTLWLRSEFEALQALRTFALNLIAAVPLYLLCPVCGPLFAFAGFPFIQPAQLTPHPILINAAPNGVPSVHASTALLILWFLPKPRTLNRISALDGWRGIAILLVLFDHIQDAVLHRYARPWTQTGQHGVTIFFVLSGFLITSKLIEGPIGLKQFYLRRLFRLMPVAWTFLAAMALFNRLVHAHFT